MVDRDERIRRMAYHFWVEEGRPSGRDADHWERAREEVERDETREEKTAPADTAPPEIVASPVPPAAPTEPLVSAAKPKAAPRKAGVGRAPAKPRKAKGA